MKNVVDLASKRKQMKTDIVVTRDEKAPVVNMLEKREELIQTEKRKKERIIMREMISAFVVVPQRGLVKVEVTNISEQGLALAVNSDLGKFRLGDELALRVYLTQKSYFPFVAKVANVRYDEKEKVYRHGMILEQNNANSVAFNLFSQFIKAVSTNLVEDSGDLVASGGRF